MGMKSAGPSSSLAWVASLLVWSQFITGLCGQSGSGGEFAAQFAQTGAEGP